MASLKPRAHRTAQNTQFSYDLDRRVHVVKTYPTLSPQGATILIYGHENGVTLVWRGGRRLKASKKKDSRQSGKGKQNGSKAAEDTVMILDSDEEDSAPATSSATFVDKPEFEDAVSDIENTCPEIVQTLDLALGTEVLHVAVLPMTPCAAEDVVPGFLRDKMAFAFSCSTNSVYVITLPLTPPSQESKERSELRTNLMAGNAGNGKWGETLISLAGQERFSDGLAMALVKQKTSASERSKSSERSRSGSAPAATRVIVAAHSREASGTLRLWDVSLDAKRGTADRALQPFQTEYLPSPLTGIAFNPSHSTQLLATDSPHAVRIYDYSFPSTPSDDSKGPFPSQGSWLLSLYPPFARGSLTSIARKPIVAAAWIAHGRAVLTLLADGQWGIWDIDGAGPLSTGSGTNLFGKAGVGVRGAALTSFSASGQLEGTSPLRNPATRKSEGEFVPMTPHTRRDALTTSFVGGVERLAAIRGGIDVTPLPTLRSGSGEEAAVLWLGGADHIITIIPGISRFWDAQVRRSAGGGVNLFSGAQPTRMIRLIDLNTGLMGERCCGVGAVARFPRRFSDDDGAPGSGEGLPIEVLIQGESRLVVVRESEDTSTPLTSRLYGSRKRKLGPAPTSEPASAIIVHPRPDKPAATVSFDLSVTKRGTLRAPKVPQDSFAFSTAGSSFDKSLQQHMPDSQETVPFTDTGEVTMTQSMMRDFGFVSLAELDTAADAGDDDGAVRERDVEKEMLDIMELDHELDVMESERESGTKHVFFEMG